MARVTPLVLTCGLLLSTATSARADGSDPAGLGPPSIGVSPGTGIVGAGTGLITQPGIINLNVPLGVNIQQVILYWEGLSPNPPGDNTIEVNGVPVIGTLIGGPTLFFPNNFSTTYRADITALAQANGWVVPGANILTISGMDYEIGGVGENDGAGILVIFDDGTFPKAQINLRDGNDLAFAGFAPPLDATVAQTFNFPAAGFPRQADVVLFVGSVDVNRNSIIRITTGGNVTDIVDLLGNTDGPQWDTVSSSVVVPAGANSISFEILSAGGPDPASLAWLTGSFAVLPAPLDGTVIIEKLTIPAGGTDFDFTDNIEAPNAFTLDHGENKVFNNVAPGAYSVTELDPAADGYALSNLVCVDGDPFGIPTIVNLGTRTATINVDPGETVTCTYTNVPLPGTVVINKLTLPPGGGGFGFTDTIIFPNIFALNDGGSKVFNNVPAGTYQVTENDPQVAPGGYELSSLVCSDSDAGGTASTWDLITRTATINVDPGETVTCTFTNAAPEECRMSASEKGSLLIYPKVELRWDASGNALIQDTFIDLTNDYPGDVCVQMYFIQGDPELEANGLERYHPCCNNLDVQICLTGNQPTYWSAATGQPANGGLASFISLDPGPPPGRPDPEGGNFRVLRGYIVAWAVDHLGQEIRWNHLKGDAVIVNYREGTAWEYTAYASRVTNVPHGQVSGTPGELHLDGTEYCPPYELLLLDFYAVGAQAFYRDGQIVNVNTDLTLLPVDADLRQETDGPVTTKASFTIWNMNETKLTGLDLCITCWDQRLFTSYGIPNHFLVENLQTDKGKARIDGIRSQLCDLDYDQGDICTQNSLAAGGNGPNPNCDPRDVLSVDAALLGLAAKELTFGDLPRLVPQTRERAGMNLIGMGKQNALILADLLGEAPPERPELLPVPEESRVETIDRRSDAPGPRR